MSKAECLALLDLGAEWYANVVLQPDSQQRTANRNQILNSLVVVLPGHITVRRGFQDYDPVVRVSGVAYKYSEIANWAAGQNDGGLQAAQLFGAWATRDDVALTALPKQLQALAVITCFAEKARNLYDPNQLGNWMNGILTQGGNPAGAAAAWRDFERQWPPSLTYRTDVALDWT